jgi:hypothetical protein
MLTGLGAAPALAQSAAAPPSPGADMRQVRDELERLKKDFDALRQEYDQRISLLEQRLGGLASGPNVVERSEAPGASQEPQSPAPPPTAPPPAAPSAPAEPAPAPSAQPQGGLVGASKVFNPDTSVIGNLVGVAGDNPQSSQPSMDLSEVEVAFQAVVDPYAKADFFLSASPEGLSIEEGYLTFTSLPAGLLLKVGKMRAQFGKVNTMHTHALSFADRPLVTRSLLGGDDGINDAGLSVSKLIPNDVLFLEATGEVFHPDSDVFKSSARSKLEYVGHLRGYRDLTEGTNLDLGVSFASGPSATSPDFNKQLIGIDATFHYRPLRRAIYHRFIGRAELVWSRHDMPLGPQQRAFGIYGSADYQFARRWYVGARLDRSGRIQSELIDSGGSAYVTFWPSEFSQIRGQYRRTSYGEGIVANELLFQFNFSIGAHGAHVF